MAKNKHDEMLKKKNKKKKKQEEDGRDNLLVLPL